MENKIKCNSAMRFFVFFCLLFPAVSQAVQKDILFHTNFNNYNVTASVSKGKAKSINFHGDLQLRMYPGVNGKGNAITLLANERCAYDARGNINPKEGTISFWLSPLNWKTSKQGRVDLIEIRSKGFSFKIIKEKHPYQLLAILDAFDQNGKAIRHYVRTPMWLPDWNTGKWHHVAVTWNDSNLKIYVDGVLPPNTKPDKSKGWYGGDTSKKFAPIVLPEIADGDISIGPRFNRNYMNPDDKTAFDEFSIFNRQLSAEEILKEYEKHAGTTIGKNLKKPKLAVPLAKNDVKLDGIISSGEWDDASIIPLYRKFGSGDAADFPTILKIKHSKKKLYLCFECPWNPAKKDSVLRDSAVFMDDSVEFHLKNTTGKKQYQFIINANGAVLDSSGVLDHLFRGMKKEWNSGIRSAAKQNPGSWICEIELPMSDLEMNPGDIWYANFCDSRVGSKNIVRHVWSETSQYFNPETYGKIEILSDSRPVSFSVSGFLNSGNFSVKTNRSVQVDCIGENKLNLNSHDGRFQADPGRYLISAICQDGNKLLMEYEIFFEVKSNPLDFDFTVYAAEQKIELKPDLINAGIEALNAVRGNGIAVTAELIYQKTGKKIAEVTQVVKSLTPDFSMKIPDISKIPSGEYQVKITAEIGNRKLEIGKNLHVPAERSWLNKHLYADHSVPPPWIPVKKLTAKRFEVLDREYIFGDSPFPVQIISRGKKLLSKQPEWLISNQKIQWKSFRIVKEFPDKILLAGEGSLNGLKIEWRSELSFDGLYKLDLELLPGEGGVNLKNMTLNWKVPQESGEHALLPLYTPWNKQNRITEHIDFVKKPYFCVWTTGDETGLMWWTESLANWVNNPGEEQLKMNRDANDITVHLDMITKPSKLTRKAKYTMAFMGTPAKRPPKEWRAFNWGSPEIFLPFMTASYPAHKATTNLSSHQPISKKTYQEKIDYRKEHGTGSMLYALPPHLATNEPEFQFFYPSAAALPIQVTWKYNGYESFPTCGHTQVADLMIWRLDQFYKMFPEIKGVYYDVSDVCYCRNTAHGCGGIDAFGQNYVVNTAYTRRQFFLRAYKLTKAAGKTMILHAHSKFVPVCHVFADHWWPGEQYDNPLHIGKNPKHFYCEEIPMNEFKSGLSPVTHGMGITLLPESDKAYRKTGYKYSQDDIFRHTAASKEFRDVYMTDHYAHSVMAAMMVNDISISPLWVQWDSIVKWWMIRKSIEIGKAEFHPWWTQKMAKLSENEKVFASVYSWKNASPFGRVIVISNLSRKDQKITLTLDIEKLGFRGKYYYDLWNGKMLLPKGYAKPSFNLDVEANDFRIIAIF